LRIETPPPTLCLSQEYVEEKSTTEINQVFHHWFVPLSIECKSKTYKKTDGATHPIGLVFC